MMAWVATADEVSLRGRSVLIVDDHDSHRNLLVDYLGGLGCVCDGASGGHEALAKMSTNAFDLILLDLRMDDLDGMEVLKRARAAGFASSCVMMSAEGTISHAVEAIRLGAKDFLVKPFELEQLHETVRRVLGSRVEGSTDRRDPRLSWRDRFAPVLVGELPSLLEFFLVLERIAGTDSTVLILGESGTGKELVARAVHAASARSKRAFVPVNCGAIPETLIESELFGHAKGAFSGATQAREGRFAVADGGTLFLDEIGEMSLAVQVKFLRVLQEQEFVPVGETRPRKCDVRIIAATNKNLERMAEQRLFREDLYYRLNLIPIHLPPLRDRREDIALLAEHFRKLTCERRGLNVEGFSAEALEAMKRYAWPGNVRELENTVERMTLLHRGSGVLEVSDLPPKIRGDSGAVSVGIRAGTDPLERLGEAMSELSGTGFSRFDEPRPAVPPPSSPVATAPAAAPANTSSQDASGAPLLVDFTLPPEGIDLRRAVEAFEMSLIEQALERTGGNKNQASLLLGLNRTTLVEKLRKRRSKDDGG